MKHGHPEFEKNDAAELTVTVGKHGKIYRKHWIFGVHPTSYPVGTGGKTAGA
jgi:hypothetical protein